MRDDLNLLASPERLAARLPAEPETDREWGLVGEMLSDASAQARLYGNTAWTAETVPPGVVNIVLAAAARGYMNPAGFESEAADSNRLSRGEAYYQGTEFTAQEVSSIKRAAQRNSVSYMQTTRPHRFIARSDSQAPSRHYVAFDYYSPFPYGPGPRLGG